MTGTLRGLDDNARDDTTWARVDLLRARAASADVEPPQAPPDAAHGADDADNAEDDPADLVRAIIGLRQPWRAQGACRGVDPDLFFPARGGSTREAKEVCRSCPVREPCLEYALVRGEKFGIWGGMSERERRRVRNGRRRRTAA